MKKHFSIFMLLLVVIVGSMFLLTSCGGNSTSKAKAGEANTEVVNEGTEYIAKYYTDGGYIQLYGYNPSDMAIMGYKGNVTEINLKKIEDKIKINGKNINVSTVYNMSDCKTLQTVDLSKKNPCDEFAIVDSAFEDCENLTTVVLPDTFATEGNTISSSAFSGCKKLSSITGLEKFTKLGSNAFNDCRALTTVTLSPEIKEIPDNCFDNCLNLTTVNMGNKVEIIGNEAFYNTKVTNIDFKQMTNLEEIGASAFANAKLTKVELPDSIKDIGDYAFVNNELTLVDIPFLNYYSDIETTYNDIFGVNLMKLIFDKKLDEKTLMDKEPKDLLNLLPKVKVIIRKSAKLDEYAFSNDGLYYSNIDTVNVTFLPDGTYDWDEDGIVDDEFKTTEADLTIAQDMYDSQFNMTSFIVNGVEKFEPLPSFA